MPCDCGPDTRKLWEKVRDLMKHHDDLFERFQEVVKERDRLKKENDILFERLGEIAAGQRSETRRG